MPIYRYICEDCGNEFTVMHGMNEEPNVFCEQCGGKARKGIGRIGISFKGNGFYINDSKGSSKSSKSKSTSSTSSEKK
ncbi:putative regulatory protein, FmdB family [Marinitoga hydrogenitolerans DSM 16785]|uniref:Regulatory protein, FmdB family n=1 Tax=Marinitoga hydrogenitolerans (strain DSM 16785 / JCM 12826 / AT1271) TaxID=1122195 RepID=A0A1M4S652_MARH1|nr:FmdB family zinc ribbon protein [Marinitoga hydrogenitolerans]SHE27689.1 putative regulatory protein, FmdB family [Marinitoga hydrogenitolerans DSM 16785]